jgi:hypothetical protein
MYSRGTVRSTADFKSINDAAEIAYTRQTKKPTGLNGNDLKTLWKRVEMYVDALGSKYKIPNGTSDDDAIALYLQALSRFFEEDLNRSFPGNPEAGVLGAMTNANHQSCILYLDSILQGLYAHHHKPFDPNSRPPYVQGNTETVYFVGYADAIGNVPPP